MTADGVLGGMKKAGGHVSFENLPECSLPTTELTCRAATAVKV